MNLMGKSLLMASLLALSSATFASEARHFKGEKAESLSQAVQQFSEENKKLQAILQKGTVEPKEMADIHIMTYTLENALAKLKSELDTIEELLEDVHKASEHGDTQKVLKQGQKYLEKAQTLVP
ncbi:MAG: DUF6746 family protein [Pseudomonadota bacterium]|nr:DUF6746 family protein [Pseudomonadota bacterium]